MVTTVPESWKLQDRKELADLGVRPSDLVFARRFVQLGFDHARSHLGPITATNLEQHLEIQKAFFPLAFEAATKEFVRAHEALFVARMDEIKECYELIFRFISAAFRYHYCADRFNKELEGILTEINGA